MSRLIALLLLLLSFLMLTTASSFPLLAIYSKKPSLPLPPRTPNPYAYLGKRGVNPKSYAYFGKRIKPNPYAYFGKRSSPVDAIDDDFFTPEDAYRD